MNDTVKWPNNIFHLIISGDGNQIHQSIEQSAKLCYSDLNKAWNEKEIEDELAEQIRSKVKEETVSSSELRFALSKIDNHIKRLENTSPVLRKFMTEHKADKKKSLELFFEVLSSTQNDDHLFNQDQAMAKVHSTVVDSYRCRIKFTSYWDRILIEHRRVLVASATTTGHKLSAIALLLQDDDTISRVRKLLEQLDLQIPNETRFYSLPRKAPELQTLLIKGIQTIETQYQEITKIDQKRNELKEAHDQLYGVTLDTQIVEEQIQESKPAVIQERKKVHRMIFPDKGSYRK
jgi:hypothetical protein